MKLLPSHIILHHSLTKDSGTVSWGNIRQYHVAVNGWAAIGYHAGVELVGTEYETLFGRRWDEEGAHCRQREMNHKALGLCLIGSFDETPPPDAQLEAAAYLIKVWMDFYKIPAENVQPHRLYAPKTCPGKAFTVDLLERFVPGLNELYWR